MEAQIRRRGDVTIDNSNYGRYMGELQIVLHDLPADRRVNVIGRIVSEDLCLLEKLPSQKRANLARRLVRGYADYDLDIAKYRAVKEELLRAQ